MFKCRVWEWLFFGFFAVSSVAFSQEQKTLDAKNSTTSLKETLRAEDLWDFWASTLQRVLMRKDQALQEQDEEALAQLQLTEEWLRKVMLSHLVASENNPFLKKQTQDLYGADSASQVSAIRRQHHFQKNTKQTSNENPTDYLKYDEDRKLAEEEYSKIAGEEIFKAPAEVASVLYALVPPQNKIAGRTFRGTKLLNLAPAEALTTELRERIYQTALNYQKHQPPYVFANTLALRRTSGYFDCSSFINDLFESVGLLFADTPSWSYLESPYFELIAAEDIQKGDIAVWTRAEGFASNHVGIVTGNSVVGADGKEEPVILSMTLLGIREYRLSWIVKAKSGWLGFGSPQVQFVRWAKSE